MSASNFANIFAAGSSSTQGSSSTAPDANTSVPSLFSSTTNNASHLAKPPPIFGQTSNSGPTTTPLAAPASSSPFATSFASLSSKPSTQGGSLFGATKDNAATPSFVSTSGSSLFGNQQLTSSGLATAKSPFSSLPTGNLFGSGASSTTTPGENPPSLFGAKPTATNTDTTSASLDKQTIGSPAPSLFGNLSATTTKPPLAVPDLSVGAQKKNEGDSQSSLNVKPTFGGEIAKDPNTGDKVEGALKPENKLGSSASFSLGGSKEFSLTNKDGQPKSTSDLAVTGLTTATSTSTTSVPAPSMLRGKTVEDIVNRWSSDLETQARAFSQFASEVAVWDRALIENGNYISALYAAVIQAESTQASLDQTLEHVEQQQRQLISTLDQYEKTASDILHGSAGIMASTEGLGLADSERDKSYALAASLYTQLDDLSNSLTQMVEAVNGLNISSAPTAALGEGSNEDPISTIAGILNAHLSSLQWIDTYLRDMESKVKDAERKIHEVVNRRGSDGFSKVRSFGLSSSRR